MKKKLIWSVIVLSLVVEVFALYRLHKLLLVGMYLVRRSECTLRQTWEYGDWKVAYMQIEKGMEIRSRLLERNGSIQLWSTPRGPFWMPDTSVGLMWGVLAEQEMHVYGSGKSGVQPGDVVLDCGADIGTFTRLALEMGAARIVAVEPAPEKWPCLERNFSQEIADGTVLLFRKGVWDKEASLPISGGTVLDTAGSPSEMIQLTTIDNLVSELNLNKVDFIKMDIEGAEIKALKGASGSLRRFKPRLAISTEHYADESKDVAREVSRIVGSYEMECGPCAYLDGRIAPHVLYFR